MTPILEVEHLTRRFGGLVAVNDLSFHVNEGETLGLIGPNGSGKTTCFNMLSGAMKPSEGQITFAGERVEGLKAHEMCRRGIGRTFQMVQPFPAVTVTENVMIAAFCKTRSPVVARRKALEVLERVGMAPKAEVLGKELTLLELKRLEIAKALAVEPKVLLLDEVAAGLNAKEIEVLLDLIRTIQKEGATLIVVEHVMMFVKSLADRMLVINFGSCIAEGLPDEVLDSQAVHDAYLGEEVNLA